MKKEAKDKVGDIFRKIIGRHVTQHASEDYLRHLEASDASSGLANYCCLSKILKSEIDRSKCTSSVFAILIFGLNGMQRINNSDGHVVTDRALCRLAEIFYLSCRSTDTAARLGGGEFAIILPETSAKEAAVVGRRICKRLSEDREEPLLTVSFGIAVYPQDGITIETLFQAGNRERNIMNQLA